LAPVFREKRIFGLQPKELIEVAFDIITPAKNLVADAEVLVVTDEILQELNSFKDSGYFFRINHVGLLRGILNHFGIAEDDHGLVHDAIRAGTESKKARMATLAKVGNIPDQV
jgi:histidyl-tRNA synthetase